MPMYYPSFDALDLADTLFQEAGERTPGYEGRMGAAWYWRLPGGIIGVAHLDHAVTPERWDVIRARASNSRAGVFSEADFPFKAYGTSTTSPPFIHDMQGRAEWSNRLYFQMGELIDELVHWIEILHATAISPRVNPPASFPALSGLERRLVRYAMAELEGQFVLKSLYEAFRGEISRSRLSSLAQTWEMNNLLTSHPRRVTYALLALTDEEIGEDFR